MNSNALRVNQNDNVAIVTEVVKKGTLVVVEGKQLFNAAEDIELGHKVALSAIAGGQKVFRYGEAIVQATRDINQGEWVHIHNTQPVPGDLMQ